MEYFLILVLFAIVAIFHFFYRWHDDRETFRRLRKVYFYASDDEVREMMAQNKRK